MFVNNDIQLFSISVTKAQIVDHGLDEYNTEVSTTELRKKSILSTADLGSKYKGKITSRKDIQQSDESEGWFCTISYSIFKVCRIIVSLL